MSADEQTPFVCGRCGRAKLAIGTTMQALIHDVRYAIRLFAKAPGFSLIAVLTMGLGIGATTAIFTVVHAVLLRPLPYPDPDRLVLIRSDSPGGERRPWLSGDEIGDLRGLTGVFDQVEGIVSVDANLGSTRGNEPMARVPAASVTPGFLPMLGVRAIAGRLLTSQDAGSDRVLAVAISHELWRGRYGAYPSIAGRLIEVNNMRVAVAGVLPPGFRVFVAPDANIPARIDVWFPMTLAGARNDRAFTTVARLKPGTSAGTARHEVTALAGRLSAEHPAAYSGIPLRLHVDPLHDDSVAGARPALLALMSAVTVVLLIASANVANLLIARTASRTRELAVRSAVGAERRRLLRQVVTEGLVLGVAGGGVGLLLALWAEALLLWLRPPTLSGLESLPLDLDVLGFAVATAFGSALVFSSVPAWQGTRLDLPDALKAGTPQRGATGRMRPSLVAVQIGLSTVLLIAAGLMLRTVGSLRSIELGFEPDRLLTAQSTMQPREFREYGKRWQFYRTALERIRELPGVESASAVRPLPLEPFRIAERIAAGDRELVSEVYTTLPGYFDTLKIQLISGRDFTNADLTHSGSVVIVDDEFARQAWPGLDPIGRLLRVRREVRDGKPLSVIGIVKHIRAETLRDAGKPQVYLPYHEHALFDMAVVVRTAGEPLPLAPAVRREIELLGGGRPVHTMRPMAAYVADMTSESRFALMLLGIFAGLALVLSAVGVYGVVSGAAAQRTREIGIRMAFGASPAGILRLVVGHGVRWAATGAATGVLISLGTTRYLRGLLFGVTPTDPMTFLAVTAVLGLVALVACYLPARRAAAAEPSVALRAE